MPKIAKIDRNMASSGLNDAEYFKAGTKEMPVFGLAFFDNDKKFCRWPQNKIEQLEKVNKDLIFLGRNTSGAQIRFKTDSDFINIKCDLEFLHDMTNMTAVGQCGFDCYIKYPDKNDYIFSGITNFDISKKFYDIPVMTDKGNQLKDIIINFPLYCGVESVEVGIKKGSVLLPPEPLNKRMLFYGTSITQGGCASRPGMSYTNILSRKFNAEVFNFGFSANGLGESEVAEVIASIKNLDFICLDYEANSATNGRMVKSLVDFINIIRGSYKTIPILVASRIPYTGDFMLRDTGILRDNMREFQKSTVQNFRAKGDNNIYFINGYDMFPEDFYDFTVDYIHPTDLGFYFMANAFEKEIKKIFNT